MEEDRTTPSGRPTDKPRGVPKTDEERKAADDFLYLCWLEFKPPTVYGRIYRRGLLLAFKP